MCPVLSPTSWDTSDLVAVAFLSAGEGTGLLGCILLLPASMVKDWVTMMWQWTGAIPLEAR